MHTIVVIYGAVINNGQSACVRLNNPTYTTISIETVRGNDAQYFADCSGIRLDIPQPRAREVLVSMKWRSYSAMGGRANSGLRTLI